jgi:hypothetical protein
MPLISVKCVMRVRVRVAARRRTERTTRKRQEKGVVQNKTKMELQRSKRRRKRWAVKRRPFRSVRQERDDDGMHFAPRKQEKGGFTKRGGQGSQAHTHIIILIVFWGEGEAGGRKGKARERKKRDLSKFEHDDVKKGRNELS